MDVGPDSIAFLTTPETRFVAEENGLPGQIRSMQTDLVAIYYCPLSTPALIAYVDSSKVGVEKGTRTNVPVKVRQIRDRVIDIQGLCSSATLAFSSRRIAVPFLLPASILKTHFRRTLEIVTEVGRGW